MLVFRHRTVMMRYAALVLAVTCYFPTTINADALGDDRTITSSDSSSTSLSTKEPDYTQESIVANRSPGDFFEITNGKLALYFELPVLFAALSIGIGALITRCRQHLSNDWK